MFETNFTSLDWCIVAVYLAGTVLLGMYVNRHVHNAADYLVGGRSAGAALAVASFIGTGLGLVTLMYAAMEGFNRGFAFLLVPLLYMSVACFSGASGFVVSRLRELRLTTIPEFFERRFNRRVRITSGIICALAGILNMGLFPKMGATFITYATGMGETDGSAEVTVNIITSLLIVMVLAYTVLGGMVAVIVTDYIQFIVLSLGLGLGLWICMSGPELGWDNFVGTLVSLKGEAAFNPAAPTGYGWAWVVWQVCIALTASICWAPEVTRVLTTKDVRASRWTYFFGSTGFFARMAIPAIWGIAAFCYFGSDSELGDYFSDASLQLHGERAAQAMPLLLGKLLPAGLLGLLVAGLMAAFMSTHDSYLLAWASVISQDVVAPLKGVRRLSDAQSIRYTRVAVLLIGVFLLVWGIWFPLPDSVWNYMGVTGTIYLSGSATALMGGMYWRRASSTGALWAMLGGLLAVAGAFAEPMQNAIGGMLGQPASSVAAWLNLSSISAAVYGICVVLFVAGSLLVPDEVDGTSASEAA